MHVHIQNRPNDHFVPLTEALVRQVTAGSPYRFTVSDDDAGFAAAAGTMEILVTTSDQLLARFPCPAPKLKAVFLKHAGVDRLVGRNPLPEQVMLLNNSGAHGQKAGEYALMAALMLQAGMLGFVRQQSEGVWKTYFSGTLAARRVTILGVGGLGAAAARALRLHGVRVTGVRNRVEAHADFDRVLGFEGFDAVLPETDILVLAAPLTEATRNIMDARRLGLLPRHAGLINIARGELVDEAALVEALRTGVIAGAIIDVTVTEPLPQDDPLWQASNLMITPHVSATDIDAYAIETMRVLMHNLTDIVEGRQPRNLVDLKLGY
jgi:glyoxylate/hydroxypyruvate reductase A